MRSQGNRSDVRSEEHKEANVEGPATRVVEVPPLQHGLFISQSRANRAAFIGTRRVEEVSDLAHNVYLDLVEKAVGAGYTIRTGAAPGADQIAAMRALCSGGTVELVLPWETYEKEWVNATSAQFPDKVWVEVYDYEYNIDWRESVKAYHPAWMTLKPYAYSLHARNYGIIEPCEVVVALCAPDRKGGTEQGIRIAEALEKRRIILESPSGSRGGRVVVNTIDPTYSGGTSRVSIQSDSSVQDL